MAVRNERNLGLVATLNKGIALARGELIARIDADDVADSRRFELQVDRFERDAGLVALGTGIRHIDAAGRVVSVPPRQAQGRYFLRWRVLRGTCLYHPTLMLHRARAGADAYYSGDFVHAEDYELLLRLSRSRALDNLAEPLVALRQHDASVSRQFRSEQRASAARALVLHVRHLYALDLPVGVAEALIDPVTCSCFAVQSRRAGCRVARAGEAIPAAEIGLPGEDRVAVNRDVAFMFWKFIAIAATDWHGGASLRQRFATLAAAPLRSCSVPALRSRPSDRVRLRRSSEVSVVSQHAIEFREVLVPRLVQEQHGLFTGSPMPSRGNAARLRPITATSVVDECQDRLLGHARLVPITSRAFEYGAISRGSAVCDCS